MRHFIPALVLLCAVSLPVRAFSQQGSGSGGGFSGSGTFAATENQDGSYTIDSLTGDPSSGIQGLIATGGFNGNDNLLFPYSSSVVDGSGFSFTDVQGDTAFQVNIFATDSNGDYSAYLYDSDGFSATIPVSFSVGGDAAPKLVHSLAISDSGDTDFTFSIGAVGPSATPEPSGLVLLGTGLLVVGGFASRRLRRI